jgi:hypothetical protein
MTAPINRMIGANVLQCSDVRFGSKADIEAPPTSLAMLAAIRRASSRVRLTPNHRASAIRIQ